jgi:hypothetical protein
MRRIGRSGLLWFFVTIAAAAQSLEPLDTRHGFGEMEFGTASTQLGDLLPWGQEDGMAIFVADMNPEIAGVKFEARKLQFWKDKLARIQFVTTDLNSARRYFKLMTQSYGRPSSKLGPNSYESKGQKVWASYGEDGKTATITYASISIEREWQKRKK